MRIQKLDDLRRQLDLRWLFNFSIIVLMCGLVISFSSFALAIEDSDVEKAFVKFQHDWIEKLNHYGKYGKKNVEVKEDQDHKGTYVASYLELSDPFEYRIKKTGQKGSPYVGVIRYKKMEYSSRGKTPEEASNGNFECKRQLTVTEIFRFSGGKWVY